MADFTTNAQIHESALMKKIFLILLIVPIFTFSQKKDYKNYDKAVTFFNNGEIEKAKKSINKCIQKNIEWEKPYQLLGNIYELEGDIELAVKNYYKGFHKIFFSSAGRPKDSFVALKSGQFSQGKMRSKVLKSIKK